VRAEEPLREISDETIQVDGFTLPTLLILELIEVVEEVERFVTLFIVGQL
jgi:hypothetical protein